MLLGSWNGRLKGWLQLRFWIITVIKSYSQLPTALQNRNYLDWNFLGNFQDSQTDFRKFQEKELEKILEKFIDFQEQRTSYPIWLQGEKKVSRDINREKWIQRDWGQNWEKLELGGRVQERREKPTDPGHPNRMSLDWSQRGAGDRIYTGNDQREQARGTWA